jgi:hypothetical protein
MLPSPNLFNPASGGARTITSSQSKNLIPGKSHRKLAEGQNIMECGALFIFFILKKTKAFSKNKEFFYKFICIKNKRIFEKIILTKCWLYA